MTSPLSVRLATVLVAAAGVSVLAAAPSHAAGCPSTYPPNPTCVVVPPPPAPPLSTTVLGETIVRGVTITHRAATQTDPTSAHGSSLPFTGADILPVVAIGGALLFGGSGLVVIGSRRRRQD